MGHYNSFLLRVWTDEHNNEIRGSVQHVGTQENIHFTSWDKMIEFITKHLSWQMNPELDNDNEQVSRNVEIAEKG